jgi:hypothetical protein
MFFYFTACRPDLRPIKPPIQRIPRALSPEIKPPEREANHSHPSSAETKNDGDIPPLHHTSSWSGVLLIKHRQNLAFFNLLVE